MFKNQVFHIQSPFSAQLVHSKQPYHNSSMMGISFSIIKMQLYALFVNILSILLMLLFLLLDLLREFLQAFSEFYCCLLQYFLSKADHKVCSRHFPKFQALLLLCDGEPKIFFTRKLYCCITF